MVGQEHSQSFKDWLCCVDKVTHNVYTTVVR